MKLKEKSRLLLPLVLLVSTAVLVAGCKKKPPPVTETPEPPTVERTAPAETEVKEQPMRPPIEEKTAPARSMSALEAQGLLKAIYFDFDRYEIRPDQRTSLSANADLLNGRLSSFRILIEGHCDERGTNEYNMTLGDRRANATKQYLIDMGISPSRVRTISFGEERPADVGHNETAWAKNRRSEFVLEEG